MFEHLLHNGCGERDAVLALVSDWPLIGCYLRGLVLRFRLRRKRSSVPE